MALAVALRAGVDLRLVIVYVAALLAAFGYKLVRRRGRRPTAITTRTWEAFQQGLVWEVGRLEAGTKVVIAAAAERRAYVQVARDADRLYAEAVSNRVLRGDRRQSPGQEQRLAGAGWQPPDERHPNWWCDRQGLLSATDSQQLAALIVIALQEGLGIAQPQELQYRAWNDATRKRVDLPGLHPVEL
ncbi:MAG TPA: hypothetical protein VGS80_15005 [Ktedonobacterales bacterium]|nr:hypothetical protein [Ktedonobacterales bacterium]